jgi:hypothetical protein
LFLLFHQRNYNKVLSLTVFNERENLNKISASLLRYQAYSSFFTKNYHHSQLCLELLKEKDAANSRDCNFLAFIYARHNEKEKAISAWCMALEKEKNNKTAKKALDYIRSKGREINFIEDEFFDAIKYKEPFLIPFGIILKAFLIAVCICILITAAFFSINYISQKIINSRLNSRDKINKIYLPDYNPNLLDKPKIKDEKYSYSEKEIKDIFEKIKSDILDDKVVEAQISINKIKLSNASIQVKLKMDILENFIREPDYSKFKNKISCQDFYKEKKIYNNAYILWTGTVKNLSVSKEKILFDLIIGSEEKGIITGIIPVILKKDKIINNNDKAGVFGKLKTDSDKNSGNYFIEGKFIIKDAEFLKSYADN